MSRRSPSAPPRLRRLRRGARRRRPGGDHDRTRPRRGRPSRRTRPAGPPRGPVPILSILGQLLVEGRIDERDGVWIMRAQASPMAQPQHRREAA